MAPTRVMKHFETEKLAKAQRPKHRKGRPSKRNVVVKEVVAEVAGLLPYEKRLLDMLSGTGDGADKRMYKYAKQRLGTHKRAVAKREAIKDVHAKMKARQAMGN